MNKNKKMVTLSIIMMAIGAVGGILYYIYSGKSNELNEERAAEQRAKISEDVSSFRQDFTLQRKESDSLIMTAVESTGTKILEQQKESSKNEFVQHENSTNQIIKKIEETNKNQVENQDKILNKLEELSSHSYKPLDQNIRRQIIQHLSKLRSNYSSFPQLSIEIETGNSMRHKVALELESILTPLNLGGYGKGNVFMGRFPDYPITVFTNPENIQYVKDLLDILCIYIKEGITVQPDSRFPADFIRIYINGTPEFYNDGTIKVI